MKYYLVAGEASGDLHGANLIRAIKRLDEKAAFRCWGGDRMASTGATLISHYRDRAYMGFVDVARHLPAIVKMIRKCKADIADYQPDVLILIDYPGFNLRIAKFAHKLNLKVFYYISPQVWAWKSSRVRLIKSWVDRMFVILPFEEKFYEGYDFRVDFVGHPLLDAIGDLEVDQDFRHDNQLSNKPIIALLPGSRPKEIERKLPIMAALAALFPDYQFVISGVSSVSSEIYDQYATGNNLKLLIDETYQLLLHSVAAIVTSGTATLETAQLGVPQVVCYKGDPLSFLIGKKLVKVNYISLVNLIMEKEVVKELIQSELTVKNLEQALRDILGEEKRKKIESDYSQLKTRLGGPGASERAARLMIKYLME